MLKITIPEMEIYDEEKEIFLNTKETHLRLEHSLISIKKWESRWHKPFLGKENKTIEEIKDYIYCMSLDSIDENILKYIPSHLIEEIIQYIKDPMTATWFNDKHVNIESSKNSKEVITAEIIYYWMITFGVPVEFEKWHINSLLTLIKVISIKNGPNKKMSRKEEMLQRKAINNQRKAKHRTRG